MKKTEVGIKTCRRQYPSLAFRVAVGFLSLLLMTACTCYRGAGEPPQVVPLPGAQSGTASAAVLEEPEPQPVIPPEPPPSDFQLWTQISLRLVHDPLVPAGILVAVRQQEVWLSGTLDSGAACIRAEAIAQATRGVTAVHNEIVAPPASDEESALARRVPEEIQALQPRFATISPPMAHPEVSPTLRVLPRDAAGPSTPEREEEQQTPGQVPQAVIGGPTNEASAGVAPSGEVPGVTVPTSEEVPPLGELQPRSAGETGPHPETSPASQVEELPPVGPRHPTDAEAEEGQGTETPVRTYLVRPGDSLWTIAASQLGDGTRWQELYEANQEVIGEDPMRLQAGQVLTLP
ncbi:MAG: LysM peptidoglycan-binding domain-containing protein [Bradymonadales bacterium]|nr:LysM peptidoglycan-binding domain-containing protein [Bradymonadales bacterium]